MVHCVDASTNSLSRCKSVAFHRWQRIAAIVTEGCKWKKTDFERKQSLKHCHNSSAIKIKIDLLITQQIHRKMTDTITCVWRQRQVYSSQMV